MKPDILFAALFSALIVLVLNGDIVFALIAFGATMAACNLLDLHKELNK